MAHKPPTRQYSTMSTTWSNLDEDDDNGPLGALGDGAGPPGLFGMLSAASQSRYTVLEEEDDSEDSSEESTHTSLSDASSAPPPALNLKTRKHHLDNLNIDALVSVSRLAQLSVSNYAVPAPSIHSPSEHTHDPESAPQPFHNNHTLLDEPLSPSPDARRPDPALILAVLQREFGPLARDGEEEVFLGEVDGALMQDATILGTMHITSHRLTFHASLLSTRPDLEPTAQIIKSGPIVVHRHGLHRKRRRWIELSHDMISVYQDATEESRARPLRSILLSSITEVADPDPSHPRIVKISYEGELSYRSNGVLEFDTEESALEWSRELKNAVFLYRHRKREVIYGQDTDATAQRVRRENSGVRICIPLTRIDKLTAEPWFDFALLMSITLSSASPSPEFNTSSATFDSSSADVPPSPSALPQEFRFMILKSAPRAALEEAMHEARVRAATYETPAWDTVTVDYGSLVFAEKGEKDIMSTAGAGDTTSHVNPSGEDKDREEMAIKQRSFDATERRVRNMFAIEDDIEIYINRAWLSGKVCSSGFFVVCQKSICFWSKSYITTDIKYRFDVRDINSAEPTSSFMFGQSGFALEIRGHKTLHFAVASKELRDVIIKRIMSAKIHAANRGTLSGASTPPMVSRMDSVSSAVKVDVGLVDVVRQKLGLGTWDGSSTPHSRSTTTTSAPSTTTTFPDSISSALGGNGGDTHTIRSSVTGSTSTGPGTPSTHSFRGMNSSPVPFVSGEHGHPGHVCDEGCSATDILAPISHIVDLVKSHEIPNEIYKQFAKPINLPNTLLRGMASRHFVCLTIGSRGDVQPYIALGLGLKREGHRVTIVTHEEYKEWVEGFGIGHRTAGGDPGALMKLSVEHSMFSPQFFKESLSKFRGWLDDLLMDSWNQCHDADVLIESPSAMAGVHVAEALKIPYIRAFTMPWTRTTAYPHAFLTPPVELSGSLNYATYVLFDNIFWTALSGQVNRWRVKTLNLKRTDIETLGQTKVPFIYNFSPSVVPKPLDWADYITVSGYWFLDNPDLNWTPPPGLIDFMDKARADGKPIVYIGFGSITVPHPRAMTRSIIKGVLKSDVRAIISKGWSDRMASADDNEPEVPMPPECFSLDKVPHDWLFPQIDAALHHGGAGTTGASLRAGIPTLIKPWFGDQFFWAGRVQKLGAGLRVDGLGSSELATALKKATSDRIMREKASAVGEKIRAENGVLNAIKAIYTYLPRAAQDRTTL